MSYVNTSNVELKTKMQDEGITELPQYTSPGGYTIIYITDENHILCACCATKAVNTPDEMDWGNSVIVAYGTYDEGASLECDECGKELESSYGDPDNEQED